MPHQVYRVRNHDQTQLLLKIRFIVNLVVTDMICVLIWQCIHMGHWILFLVMNSWVCQAFMCSWVRKTTVFCYHIELFFTELQILWSSTLSVRCRFTSLPHPLQLLVTLAMLADDAVISKLRTSILGGVERANSTALAMSSASSDCEWNHNSINEYTEPLKCQCQ